MILTANCTGRFNREDLGRRLGGERQRLCRRGGDQGAGFRPDTTKTVQIVLDGAKGLKEKLEPLFPNAIITLDVCHVVEKLWSWAIAFTEEGSEELKAWVEELKELVYQGRAATLVKRLQTLLKQVPMHGPGTKGRRQALKKLIGYLKPRLKMMQYRKWISEDLVIASGQVEGAVRHVVGERMDSPACVRYLNVPKSCCTCAVSS